MDRAGAFVVPNTARSGQSQAAGFLIYLSRVKPLNRLNHASGWLARAISKKLVRQRSAKLSSEHLPSTSFTYTTLKRLPPFPSTPCPPLPPPSLLILPAVNMFGGSRSIATEPPPSPWPSPPDPPISSWTNSTTTTSTRFWPAGLTGELSNRSYALSTVTVPSPQCDPFSLMCSYSRGSGTQACQRWLSHPP